MRISNRAIDSADPASSPTEVSTRDRVPRMPAQVDALGPVGRRRGTISRFAGHTLLRVALIGGAVIMIFPFVWMVATSFRDLISTMANPLQLIPSPWVWNNYTDVFNELPFSRFVVNTLVLATARTLGQIVTCSLAAYAFARLRFPGKNVIFILYLAGLMVPFQVILVPEFILVKWMGWLNTYQGLIAPGLFSAFGTFLLRQFFMTLPRDLEEAALLDGAGYLRILWSVVLPLSMPALSALTIFTFLDSWNTFLWPLVATTSTDMYTLSVGLQTLQGEFSTNWPDLMAGAVVASVPMILVYLVLQKYFVQGVALSGIKG